MAAALHASRAGKGCPAPPPRTRTAVMTSSIVNLQPITLRSFHSACATPNCTGRQAGRQAGREGR